MALTDAQFGERAAERVRAHDTRAIGGQIKGLRNLAESMRRDPKWRISAMAVSEAAWTIEKLLEAQSERTGA